MKFKNRFSNESEIANQISLTKGDQTYVVRYENERELEAIRELVARARQVNGKAKKFDVSCLNAEYKDYFYSYLPL